MTLSEASGPKELLPRRFAGPFFVSSKRPSSSRNRLMEDYTRLSKAELIQRLQMLEHGGQADRQWPRQFRHRCGSPRQPRQHGPPGRIGQSRKGMIEVRTVKHSLN